MTGDRRLLRRSRRRRSREPGATRARTTPAAARVATWLLSITRNLAIDHLRARRTEPLDPRRSRWPSGPCGPHPPHQLDGRPGELRETLARCRPTSAGRCCSRPCSVYGARDRCDRGDSPRHGEDADPCSDAEARAAERERGRRRSDDPRLRRDAGAGPRAGARDRRRPERAEALDHLAGCPPAERASNTSRPSPTTADVRAPRSKPPAGFEPRVATALIAPAPSGAAGPRLAIPAPPLVASAASPPPRSGSRSPTTARSPTSTARRSRSPTGSISTRSRFTWAGRHSRSATSTATRAEPRGCSRLDVRLPDVYGT